MENDNRRKFIRFYPDDGTVAQIDLNTDKSKFHPELTALVLEESKSGCGLVILEKDFEMLKKNFLIQVGNLAPMLAEVRWDKAIDDKIRKVGIKYLE